MRRRRDARALRTEAEALRLRAVGASQRAIARELGLSQPGVAKALARAGRRLARQIPEQLEALKRREHAQLEIVRGEAWAAWMASRAGDRLGHPGFLDRVLATSAAIVALWGLSPTRIRAEVSTEKIVSPWEALDDAALVEAAEREIAQARARLPVPLAGPLQ